MRKNLHPSISDKIDKMLEICLFHEENGELDKSDELAEKIWEAIPEPKYVWRIGISNALTRPGTGSKRHGRMALT
jgi:hypothetical protein